MLRPNSLLQRRLNAETNFETAECCREAPPVGGDVLDAPSCDVLDAPFCDVLDAPSSTDSIICI